MSYRTHINDIQIFGNNEWYPEWAEFIQSEGINIDEDGCYEGYIENLQGMFNVIDKITRRLIDERHNEVVLGEKNWDGKPYRELTDLTDSMWLNKNTPLLMFNRMMIENAYCFLPYQVYVAVKDMIETADKPYIDNDTDCEWYCCSFKLKEGKKIHVQAG